MLDEPGAVACRVASFAKGVVNSSPATGGRNPVQINLFSPAIDYFWQKARQEPSGV